MSLDPYYQDTPISVYTPADQQFPANPASVNPYGYLDSGNYHLQNPNGRFPGDQWMYQEFVRLYGSLDPDLIKRRGGSKEEIEKAGKLRTMWQWIRTLGGRVPGLATGLIKQFVTKYGDTTTPTNPEQNPAYANSGPGVNYGPSGGYANGLLDAGRETTGDYGQYGIPDEMMGDYGRATGGDELPHYTGNGQLPQWQGSPQSANFLGWQPNNPPGSPSEWVDIYTGAPASGQGGGNPPPQDPFGPMDPGVGGPPPQPDMPAGPTGPMEIPPEIVRLAEELGIDLSLLDPQEQVAVRDMLMQVGSVPGQGMGMMDQMGAMRPGNTANLSPGDIDFGPDWSGAIDLNSVGQRMNEFLGQQGIGGLSGLEYQGTNIAGDHWGMGWRPEPEDAIFPDGVDPAIWMEFLANPGQFDTSGLPSHFGVGSGNPFAWVEALIEELSRDPSINPGFGTGDLLYRPGEEDFGTGERLYRPDARDPMGRLDRDFFGWGGGGGSLHPSMQLY